ncbi:Signal transduction histidine kinase [Nocardia amikacinitolerans]|uniref:sensor histidine kinase n=1 Tax=Nocardia amikacinitolerans TaxID=756689 RepID=UPI00082EF503|nr:nitrate- and nitrite sensing domain-containing protein [Nocardia amikacinitolerans]MCP2319029.1 Signal transduction histidine kinase [Nocardia amikacinitolerans]
MWSRPLGVRTRLLAIVLIPSVALLALGIGATWYLVKAGRNAASWAELASSVTTPAILMIEAFQEERRASLLHLAGDDDATNTLPAARKNSDEALAALESLGETASELRPDLAGDIEGYDVLYQQLPTLRGGIDAHALPSAQVFLAFNQIIDTIVLASLLAAEVAPDAEIAVELYKGVHALRAAEAVSRASAIGSAALISEQLTPEQLTELGNYVGDGRGEIAYATAVLSGKRQAQLQEITSSPTWRQLTAMEDAIMHRGIQTGDSEGATSGSTGETSGRQSTSRTTRTAEPPPLPLGIGEWQQAATAVRSQLLKLWEDQSRDAHRTAGSTGEEIARNSFYGGLAVLALTLLAFLAALLLANRFIGRMHRLRRDTLELADERLPETIRRLGEGSQVDPQEIARLDYGGDEIGQVADAFNRAHVAAVSAAIAESKTRAGVAAVFLNIAHRSQVMVHRQLALLDKAEREEENPARLDLLFQLDHLATRARRNAENLVILGGEQPGRRWRNPVPLIEVVRSAVAESLDYTRIQIGKLPEVRVSGTSVADLIHLIAELTDNATAFSPPESRVEVTGTLVGKGVAIEITDQGLGMPEAELVERNTVLASPPDFSVAALSSDARLGLFVVGKLAARHGISVRLTESDYGGVKAIVLVPTTLIATGQEPPREQAAREPHALASNGTFNGFAPVPALAAPIAPQSATAETGSGDRPALPKRRRETSAAPVAGQNGATGTRPRTAEEARTLMSAIENGTRQGRLNRVDNPTTPQEGAGDDLQAT